jgi:hypothetical protein
MLSQESTERYIYEALQAGDFVISGNKEGVSQDSIPKDHVYKDYADWCDAAGERKVAKHIFGATLRKLIPSITDGRAGGSGITRATVYYLPPLQQARKEFCKAFKSDMSIFGLEDDVVQDDGHEADDGADEFTRIRQKMLN